MDINPEWIAAVAACLTTYSFLPQAVKVIRDRDTRAISLQMYSVFTVGVMLWLVYGIMVDSVPIIVGNIVTVTLSAVILWMKIRLG